MANREQYFELDRADACRALQDARQYNTDTDRTGSKAKALYERLARAGRLMRPWSTDGTSSQSKKAVEYLNEITSILSEKIGPASRREFSEQGGPRHHAMKKTSSAQLDREIVDALTRTFRTAVKTARSEVGGPVDYTIIEKITPKKGGVEVETWAKGSAEGEHVEQRWRKFYPGVSLDAAAAYRLRHGYHEI